MKVLAAARPSLPRSGTDRWSAAEGEIVVAPYVCDDTACGCEVVHQGISSHGYSSIAMVREVSATPDRLVAACRAHLAASPWAGIVNDPAELDLLAEDLITAMCDTAAQHPVGTHLRMAYDRHGGDWVYEPLGRSANPLNP
ncbi:DUF7715 family protein [Mycolicibacterium fortuitum]